MKHKHRLPASWLACWPENVKGSKCARVSEFHSNVCRPAEFAIAHNYIYGDRQDETAAKRLRKPLSFASHCSASVIRVRAFDLAILIQRDKFREADWARAALPARDNAFSDSNPTNSHHHLPNWSHYIIRSV